MSRRCVIGFEDRPTGDGRLLRPHSITWRSGRIPLLIQVASDRDGHDGAQIIGAAWDLSRDTDGVLSARLSHPIVGLAPEMDLDQVEWSLEPRGSEEIMIVEKGRISAITLGHHPCWPGLVIER